MINKEALSPHIEPLNRLQTRLVALLTALVYFSYSFLDTIMLSPQSALFAVPFHRYVMPLLLLLVALLSLIEKRLLWTTGLLMITPISAGIMNNFIVFYGQANPIYLAEIYIGILWLYAFSGLRIFQASSCVTIFFILTFIMHSYAGLAREILYFHFFWSFFATAFGLLIAFLMERQNKIIARKNLALSEAADRDKLTGLYNRKKLEEFTASEISRCNRFEYTFSFAILDIDYFKEVNDAFGHSVGDAVLQEFSTIIQSHMRSTDLLARWGGEEFVIICVESKNTDTLSLLQRLKDAIQAHQFKEVGSKTLSAGLTQYQPGDNLETLLKRADLALYKAKAQGRNTIVQH